MSDSKPISVKDRLAYFLRREHEATGTDRPPASRADRSDGADEAPPPRGASRGWLGWRRPADDTSKSSVNDSGTDPQRSLLADRRGGASRMQRAPPKIALPPTPPSVPATPLQEHNTGATVSPRHQHDKRGSGRRASIIRTPVPQTPRSGSPTDIATSCRCPTSPTAPAVHRPPTSLPSRRVLCVLCDDVEDTEYFVAHAALTVAGYAVDVSSPSAPRARSVVRSVIRVTDSTSCEAILRAADLDGHRIVTNVDFPAAAAAIDDAADRYEALLLPGGRLSTANTLSIAHPPLLSLIRMFHARGRLIAAVSTAPVLLSAAGVTTAGHAGISLTAHPLLKYDIYPPSAYLPQPHTDETAAKQRSDASAAVAVADGNVVTAACWQGHPQYLSQVLFMLGATVSGNDLRVLVLTDTGCEVTEILTCVQVLQTLGLTVDVALPPPPPHTEAADADPRSGRRRFFTVVREFEALTAASASSAAATRLPLTGHEKPSRSFEASVADVTTVSPFDYDGIIITGGSAALRLRADPRVLKWLAKPLLAVSAGQPRVVLGTIGEGAQVLLAATVAAGCNTVREVTGYPAYVPPGSGFVQPQSPLDVHQDGHVVSCASWLAVPPFLRTFLTAMGCAVNS